MGRELVGFLSMAGEEGGDAGCLRANGDCGRDFFCKDLKKSQGYIMCIVLMSCPREEFLEF